MRGVQDVLGGRRKQLAGLGLGVRLVHHVVELLHQLLIPADMLADAGGVHNRHLGQTVVDLGRKIGFLANEIRRGRGLQNRLEAAHETRDVAARLHHHVRENAVAHLFALVIAGTLLQQTGNLHDRAGDFQIPCQEELLGGVAELEELRHEVRLLHQRVHLSHRHVGAFRILLGGEQTVLQDIVVDAHKAIDGVVIDLALLPELDGQLELLDASPILRHFLGQDHRIDPVELLVVLRKLA